NEPGPTPGQLVQNALPTNIAAMEQSFGPARFEQADGPRGRLGVAMTVRKYADQHFLATRDWSDGKSRDWQAREFIGIHRRLRRVRPRRMIRGLHDGRRGELIRGPADVHGWPLARGRRELP